MNSKLTLLAALLLAGASQAALAQEPGHDHNADRPQFQDHADHRVEGPAGVRVLVVYDLSRLARHRAVHLMR